MTRLRYHGALVTCLDGLWIRTALKAAEEIVGGDKIDFCAKPGGAQQVISNCPVTDRQLDDLAVISVGKHHVYDVVLCNHMNCLAYGSTSAFSSIEDERMAHVTDLRKGADFLSLSLYKRFEDMLYQPDAYPGVNLQHIAKVFDKQSLRVHTILLMPHDMATFDGDPKECFVVHV